MTTPGHGSLANFASAARLELLSATAIFVHSLFYADFFEDPTTWGLLGLAALSAAALERRREELA